jgi:SAM-dependent methyltransferase
VDAAGWDRRYRDPELVWTAKPNRFLVEQVADLPPARALDVAAGEGRNAVWLAEQGWQVTAADFSPVAVDKGRQLAEHHDVTVDWVVADVITWQPSTSAYDLVIVFYLHLPPAQRREAQQRAAAAVAPGGTLLVVGHDRDNLEHGVGGPQDPDILLTVEEVVDDLATTGVTVEVARQVERAVDVDGRSRTAIDTLVRAHRPSNDHRPG